MKMSMTGQMRMEQRMKLAPRMIQSMEVLQLPLMALQEKIEAELSSNPVLEQVPPTDEDGSGPNGDTEDTEALHGRIQAILGPPPLNLLQETQGNISAVLTDAQKPAFNALIAEFQDRISEQGKGSRHHRKGKGKGKHHRGRGCGNPAGPPEERP